VVGKHTHALEPWSATPRGGHVLRSAALVFVVLALLRPVWTAPVTQVSVVYALDVSRSVASGFVQSACSSRSPPTARQSRTPFAT
jgi:hypothetical protein